MSESDTEWDFFLLSRDRAPFCPESAWLSFDEARCADSTLTPSFSDSKEAAQLRFTLQIDTILGVECGKFQIALVRPGSDCDGYKLDFLATEGTAFQLAGSYFDIDGLKAISNYADLPYCANP